MLAGMSDSLYFQVFYGPGEVRYGPEGVDLSGFPCFCTDLPRARERTWGAYAGGSVRISVLIEIKWMCL